MTTRSLPYIAGPGRPGTGDATAPAAATAAAAGPRWVRPALAVLLAATAALYLWALGDSGWANDFYAAAVQSGTESWKSFLFGSLDWGNAITVDKPPASLWVMELSGRVFGFSSWSMLAPQALEGVAAVWLLFAAVRRVAGPVAGLVSGAALAVTPVAALMFRFNNPDALLTLLLVAGGYCMVRAVERGAIRWIALAGAAVGFAFLTKMLQAFLVVPAFAAMWMVAAPVDLRRRFMGLAAGLGALVASAGWFIALVELWPSGSRPYIGGSTGNSILELTLGYNGLDRLSGGSGPGGGGGGGGGTGFGGTAGLGRMFNDAFGTQVSWLIPAAAILLGAGIWFTLRTKRTDATRASLILWGGWALVTAGVFSKMSGIVHPYYAVALAPAIAALLGIGGWELWRHRDRLEARALGAATVVVSGWWASRLLDRTPDWHPWLRGTVLAAGLLGAALILLPAGMRTRWHGAAVGTVCAVAMFAAPTAFALQTASTPHTGSVPTAGPTAQGGGGGFGGGPSGGNLQPPSGGTGGATPPTDGGTGGFTPPANGTGGFTPPSGRGMDGGMGTASSELVTLLRSETGRWAAATVGSQSQAGLQLASGKAVMAIGGFNGGDDAPTLEQFRQWVADGEIGYFISGGGMGGGRDGGGSGQQIAQWVADNYTATTVGGQTVYDLTP
ncbi:MAG: glycosyltransferase family 39 protein [Thermoleophilia bacterium]|nr:glycosyltransferase family 39 protein [Thermoleophilia bacterium]